MIIQFNIIYLFFYFLILIVGLDFLLSGFLILKKNALALEKPFLLGLLLIKFTHPSDFSQKKSGLYILLFGLRNMGWYTMLAGVLIVTGSLIMIYSILIQL
jgi:hypothetical protein